MIQESRERDIKDTRGVVCVHVWGCRESSPSRP